MRGPALPAALALALALAFVLTGCLADTLLLWPPKAPAEAPAGRELLRAADGSTVEVIVARAKPAEAPVALVLCFYGNAQLAGDEVAFEARALGLLGAVPLELWGVNYAGFGGSSGKATLGGVAAAARAAYAEAVKRAAGRPIVVMGNSIGTAAALHLAASEAQLAGLVLRNPPPLRQLILRRHGWWNLWLLALPTAVQLPRALDSLRNAAHAQAPALFVTATEDGVVPARYQRGVMRAYAGPHALLELRGAGHNDPLPAWAWEQIATSIEAWVSVSRETR